jgi:hypothetical protein
MAAPVAARFRFHRSWPSRPANCDLRRACCAQLGEDQSRLPVGTQNELTLRLQRCRLIEWRLDTQPRPFSAFNPRSEIAFCETKPFGPLARGAGCSVPLVGLAYSPFRVRSAGTSRSAISLATSSTRRGVPSGFDPLNAKRPLNLTTFGDQPGKLGNGPSVPALMLIGSGADVTITDLASVPYRK